MKRLLLAIATVCCASNSTADESPTQTSGAAAPTASTTTIPVHPLREAPSPETPATAESVQLETVVVTGEKLGRTLDETASSVSVTSGKQIEDHGDESLYDLARRVGNVLADEDSQDFSLRGISSGGAEGYSTGSPVISFNVDGVTLDETAVLGGMTDVFDVDQVEILRGPQSTSQGRNALAGAVVMSTREPTRHWDLLSRVRLAETGIQQYALAGGGPISETLAFRLAAEHKQGNGEVRNITRNDPHWYDTQDQLLRGKLAWEPSSIEGLRTVLTISHSDRQQAPPYNFVADSRGPAFRRIGTENEPFSGGLRSNLISLRNAYDFSPTLALHATTATVRSQHHTGYDYDGTEEESGRGDSRNSGNTLSQELRLNFRDGRSLWGSVSGTLGVYGSLFGDDGEFHFRDLRVPASTVLRLPGAENIVARVDGDSLFDDTGENLALFSEFDFGLGERLTLTAGLRYDREHREVVSNYAITRADGYLFGNETAPPIDLLPALTAIGVIPATDGAQHAEGSYSALLPKLGIRYALMTEWTLFATYSEAYRAGGIEVLAGSGEGAGSINQYDPEYTRNYEIGFRASPQRRLDVDLNLYYVQWQDQQVRVPDPEEPLVTRTENAANSELYGAELETRWRPLQGLSLYFSAGTAHTEFKKYISNDVEYSGNEFVQAPRYTASLGGSYRHSGGLFGAASYGLSSRYYSTPGNTREEHGDARRLLDARLGWEGTHWSLYGFGRNLLDQDYNTSVIRYPTGTGRNQEGLGYHYGARRILGAQLEWQF